MKKAIFPGTFDPPTLGHLDIIRRAAHLCDQLIVSVGINSARPSTAFSIEERIFLLQRIVREIPHVTVTSFNGLLVDFVQAEGGNVIIRGLRHGIDFEYETAQAQMNRLLTQVETLFLAADPRYQFFSGTLVREIGQHGRRLQAFVPAEIEDIIFQRLSQLKKPA